MYLIFASGQIQPWAIEEVAEKSKTTENGQINHSFTEKE